MTKTVNGTKTEYFSVGGQLLGEQTGSNKTVYMTNQNGQKFGFIYNGSYYYYMINIQGDVIGIWDSSGNIVARYTYNAWGKPIAVTDGNGNDVSSNSSHIANINPIRYRGYYYDRETGFYYLLSRYYDPDVGRFINADAFLGANGDLLSYNLFTYCCNNPINYSDPTGYGFGDWLTGLFGVKKNNATATSTVLPGSVSTKTSGSTITKSISATALGSILQGKTSTGYAFRVDKANTSTQTQKHIHITKGKENYSQNIDGTPHDSGNNTGGSPPNSVKKELKKKGVWDWDGNAAKQMAMELPGPDELQEQFPFFFAPIPSPAPNPFPSPAPNPVIPWGQPIPVM